MKSLIDLACVIVPFVKFCAFQLQLAKNRWQVSEELPKILYKNEKGFFIWHVKSLFFH